MLDLLNLGTEIAAHRKRARLTQAALAERSGVSRATIAALENGAARELGFGKVMRILAVLGLDLRLTTANTGRPTLEDLQAERGER
ncbi:MAG: helix-turn-helix domain-containing protein [Alphaproteobacteria bacterium]|nr:helix-turn-helix domain-containing protein [Alphaproteobacteria bacterium]